MFVRYKISKRLYHLGYSRFCFELSILIVTLHRPGIGSEQIILKTLILKTLNQLVFIPLLFLSQFLYAQKHKSARDPFHLTKEEAAAEKRNHNCARTGNFPLAARMKNYPFNIADQIQFVSFDGLVKITDNKEFIYVSPDPPLLRAGDVDTTVYSLAKEVRPLTASQIDKLTDILYNYGFAGPITFSKTQECYEPRNAILFRDHNGKALAFMELCFECNNTRDSSEKISWGQMCDQKLDMIKALFQEVGIKYGIQ